MLARGDKTIQNKLARLSRVFTITWCLSSFRNAMCSSIAIGESSKFLDLSLDSKEQEGCVPDSSGGSQEGDQLSALWVTQQRGEKLVKKKKTTREKQAID